MSEYENREERAGLESELDELEPESVSVSESLGAKLARLGDEAYEHRNDPIPEDAKITRGHGEAKTLQVRLNVHEYEQLQAIADQRQLPVSTLARSYLLAAMKGAAPTTEDPDRRLPELAAYYESTDLADYIEQSAWEQPQTPRSALSVRLAGMSLAEIDAMTDREVAELMEATPEEFASEPARVWREAAKMATDEYADRLAEDIRTGRARLITDPAELRRLRER